MFKPSITTKIHHDYFVNDVIKFKNRVITQILFKNPQKLLFSYHNPVLIYRHSPLTTHHSPLIPQYSMSSLPYANIAAQSPDRQRGGYWLLANLGVGLIASARYWQ